MGLLANLALGFAASLAPTNVFYCFVGVLLGSLSGVPPGIGPLATIAMLLTIAYQFSDSTTALIMLAGIYYLRARVPDRGDHREPAGECSASTILVDWPR